MMTATELKEERARNKKAVIDLCLAQIQEELLKSKTNPCDVHLSEEKVGDLSREIAVELRKHKYQCTVDHNIRVGSYVYTISWEE